MTFLEDYRRGRHGAAALHAHLVFVTKNRHGVPDTDMLWCRQDAMRKACTGFGAKLRDFTGYQPTVAVSALVNSLKGISARRLRSELADWVNRHLMYGHFYSVLPRRILPRQLSIIWQYIKLQWRAG
jgi:putative transposase